MHLCMYMYMHKWAGSNTLCLYITAFETGCLTNRVPLFCLKGVQIREVSFVHVRNVILI